MSYNIPPMRRRDYMSPAVFLGDFLFSLCVMPCLNQFWLGRFLSLDLPCASLPEADLGDERWQLSASHPFLTQHPDCLLAKIASWSTMNFSCPRPITQKHFLLGKSPLSCLSQNLDSLKSDIAYIFTDMSMRWDAVWTSHRCNLIKFPPPAPPGGIEAPWLVQSGAVQQFSSLGQKMWDDGDAISAGSFTPPPQLGGGGTTVHRKPTIIPLFVYFS